MVIVNILVDVPLPPSMPMMAWLSAPLVNPPPGQPTQVVTVSVPIVDDGDLNSVEEATPVGPMVNTFTPVDEEIVRRLAV